MSADLIFLHGFHTRRCDSRVDKHFEGYYTIQLISAGAVELFYDGTRHGIEPGTYWPAYPGPHIRFHPAPGHRWWTHRYVAFCGPLATRWMADGLFPVEPQTAPPGWEPEREFDRLLALMHGSGRWDADRARNALERLLIELAACRARPREPQPWLEKTLARLADTGKPAVDYAELAAEAGLSSSGLRRQFKSATGVSLHAYALQCRISAARTLLAENALPIKEIAERLGYRDAYFFSRQFRQWSGMPPAAYRKSCQA
ncbi:MAG: AraC family transcriptional regulator [Chthoniobacteraceae bacterium]|nr:AraC family transcriptional regulator [Chthoniobacteraceae bacterium]